METLKSHNQQYVGSHSLRFKPLHTAILIMHCRQTVIASCQHFIRMSTQLNYIPWERLAWIWVWCVNVLLCPGQLLLKLCANESENGKRSVRFSNPRNPAATLPSHGNPHSVCKGCKGNTMPAGDHSVLWAWREDNRGLAWGDIGSVISSAFCWKGIKY